MQNEECIHLFEVMKDGIYPWDDSVIRDMCDCAIEALSEGPAYIKNDTVEKLDQILIWGYCFCDNDDNEYCKAIKNAIEIITALETLKAEIRDNANHCECVPDGSCISVNKVLEIIDGHIKVSDTPKPQEWVIDFANIKDAELEKMRAEIADYKGSHCIHLLDPDDLIGEILAIVDKYIGGE